MASLIDRPELQEKPEPQSPFVKQSWFDAYLLANSLWPQTVYPGILILVSASVLRDPPAFRNDLFRSLSPDQKMIMGKVLSSTHERFGIRHKSVWATNYDPLIHDEVSTSRIQKLWETAADWTDKLFRVRYSKKRLGRIMLFEDLMNNPQYQEDLNYAKKVVFAAERALLSPKGRELSYKYRQVVVADYRRSYEERILNGFLSVVIPERSKRGLVHKSTQLMREEILKEVSETNFSWLLVDKVG